MLLLPNKRVRKYQITLIVVLATTLSSMFLLVSFQPTIQAISKTSPSFFGETQDTEILADSPTILNVINIVSSIIFLIGLFILIETLFLWVPSLTDLTESKGNMLWLRRGQIFPERVLSLLEANTRIIIRRKRSSLRGLFMREFAMEIYLTKDKSNIKQIIDFSGIEKIIKTPTHSILVKTVRLEHLPLQIIQIRSILALMKPSPVKILSSK